MTIYCATTNAGKLREFRQAIESLSEGRMAVLPVPGLCDLAACDETGATFEENAIQKAIYYSRFAPGLVFVDDSGLEVEALDGEPGVRSARYAGEGAGDAANNRLLLERLQGRDDRAAQFVCVAAVGEGGTLLRTFCGVVEGRILQEARGMRGFGYDSLFFHEPFGCTFGEASDEQKLAVSHRARALGQMVAWLEREAGAGR